MICNGSFFSFITIGRNTVVVIGHIRLVRSNSRESSRFPPAHTEPYPVFPNGKNTNKKEVGKKRNERKIKIKIKRKRKRKRKREMEKERKGKKIKRK